MLDRLPSEVLQDVVYWLANEDDNKCFHYCSPWSSALPAVFLVNSTIHGRLLGATTRGEPPYYGLYVRLFRVHFDKKAFERRFGVELTSADLAAEYKHRVGVLRRIRRYNDPNFPFEDRHFELEHYEDLWSILLMLYEDDGKNMRQLLHSGAEVWTTRVILRHGVLSLNQDNWPVETELVQLSFAVLSILNTVESVKHERVDVQDWLVRLMQFYIIAPHLYPISQHPITNFFAYESGDVDPPEETTHATLPMYAPETTDVLHFGHVLTLSPPTAIESVILLMNLRRERNEVPVLPDTPENHAEAVARGRTGATREDHRENNYHRIQGLGSETPHAGSKRELENLACLPSPLLGSERYDTDMWRLISIGWTLKKSVEEITGFWNNTVYHVGMLSGKWFGRLQAPFFEDFVQMRSIHPTRPEWVDLVAQPMQFFLREHITTDPDQSINVSSVGNAWYPDGVDPSQHETLAGLAVVDPMDWRVKHYQAYNADMQFPTGRMPQPPKRFIETESNESSPEHTPMEIETAFEETYAYNPIELDSEDDYPFLDLCVTGETGARYVFAWGEFRMYGRVRKNDGLIVFVRLHPNPDVGRWIFYGYLRASTTLVGQWRVSGEDPNTLAYAGTFMMTKVGEEWGPPPAWTWPSSP